MFAIQEPPPVPPAAVQEVPPTDSHLIVVHETVRQVVLETSRASEALAVRYFFTLKAAVWRELPEPARGLLDRCRWQMNAILQKDICFSSISGLTGCTEAMTESLPISASGIANLDPAAVDDPTACTLDHPSAKAAEAGLVQQITTRAPQLAANDYAVKVRPALEKTGGRARLR